MQILNRTLLPLSLYPSPSRGEGRVGVIDPSLCPTLKKAFEKRGISTEPLLGHSYARYTESFPGNHPDDRQLPN